MEQYLVTIDPTKTLAQMIEAGKYAHAHEAINEKNFPLNPLAGNSDYRTPPTEVALELIRCETTVTKEIETILDLRGFRPAILTELLALGAKYPELQKRPLVALGSSWVNPSGDRCIPYLGQGGGLRCLYLFLGADSSGVGWLGGHFRFVAVRK